MATPGNGRGLFMGSLRRATAAGRKQRHAERRAQQADGTLPYDVPAGIDLRRRRSPVIQEGTRMSSRLSLMVASVALAFAASTAFAAPQATDTGAKKTPNAQQQRMTDC